mmetsp:Transcript_15618/g.27938  ORF Transcript_15618/g.27938 Transcript_15618/m.27938 type:complete len:217 (+) Transcript_15618:950-1600(+)
MGSPLALSGTLTTIPRSMITHLPCASSMRFSKDMSWCASPSEWSTSRPSKICSRYKKVSASEKRPCASTTLNISSSKHGMIVYIQLSSSRHSKIGNTHNGSPRRSGAATRPDILSVIYCIPAISFNGFSFIPLRALFICSTRSFEMHLTATRRFVIRNMGAPPPAAAGVAGPPNVDRKPPKKPPPPPPPACAAAAAAAAGSSVGTTSSTCASRTRP